MTLLNAISEFEITLSGGFAIFSLLCVAYVLVGSIIKILNYFTKKQNPYQHDARQKYSGDKKIEKLKT